jgi:hypothetical protein
MALFPPRIGPVRPGDVLPLPLPPALGSGRYGCPVSPEVRSSDAGPLGDEGGSGVSGRGLVRPVRCRAVAGAVLGRVAHAVAYVDTFAELIDKPIWAAEVNAGDGSHPTTAGYERLTEIIFKPWWAWPTH